MASQCRLARRILFDRYTQKERFIKLVEPIQWRCSDTPLDSPTKDNWNLMESIVAVNEMNIQSLGDQNTAF
ncbi:hypothetical protein EUGRSUZ_J02301 [Eucalyptus grandis]|uniref:Uncharacterized protein n=2 Tax=Eucalyptus grandis TaxID=71139 RepID=A0ACC3J7R8_EUCGR|nr:hypothetical protein EUGRSUZ_J02301 [Eucalyptus grandis]